MIANEPDKKRRWNQSAQHERENVSTNLRITGHKETHEHNAERHERVEMKERHRGVQRKLNPKRPRDENIFRANARVRSSRRESRKESRAESQTLSVEYFSRRYC